MDHRDVPPSSSSTPLNPPTLDLSSEDAKPDASPIFMKGPKRKRLAKACDACHKSKRRCDGTAPCSNCYYASKPCTYTDSAGRPVPAPRSFKQERETNPNQLQPGSSANDYQSSSYGTHTPYPTDTSRYPQPSRAYPSTSATTSVPPLLPLEPSERDRLSSRKRFRTDRGHAVSSEEIFLDVPIIGMTIDRPAHVELDHGLTRELINLFFTHCHPARAVIHKPSFSNALSHNRVPQHLLHAVCALAAPLSKQPRIRTNPSRFAGKPFAQEALSLMFDGAGRLVCEPDLSTAQALALLLMHDVVTKEKNTLWNTRYADLALQILENLGVHEPDHPTLTPMPSADFIHQSFKREAVRRIFWLIHLLDVMASIYFKKPATFSSSELRLRLPVDETSFELGVHSTLPEYLYLGAIRTHYASELGHLIRVVTIYAQVEFALDGLNDPETNMAPQAALVEAERSLDSWLDSLPDHLRFSDQNLQVQKSMFETSSNTGAWCWCFMHMYHASCSLALNLARQRPQRGQKIEPQWALDTLKIIMNLLGDRAKNSILLGATLYSLIKYCKMDDPQVRAWNADYETAWGINMAQLAQEYRQQLSPSSQHQHPPSSHPPSKPQDQHQQPLHHHPSPRRPSDSRHPGQVHTGLQPSNVQGEVSMGGHRSPSNSPRSYPSGGRVDETQLRTIVNRPKSSFADRDVRQGMNSLTAGPAGSIGSSTGHSGNDDRGSYNERERESAPGSITGASEGVPDVATSFPNGQREPSLSLPSLKASGLLDSWSNPSRDVEPQFRQQTSQRKASSSASPPSSTGVGNDSDVRSTTSLGMPIGLPWLAHDSR
ncbi:hypothetical protein AGABI1DRAFT_118907 [Agaricus bisporus var. burnettii JB137-S8]|uniref:Zn(2)-C6 fungal-type domain-containing protein n=2 Tax=Agaricus bisporus var. burnettii TaxID=192524 RepID=K5W4V9_AGABU|nr:uncharacterized protein AGABI1DRAFT_118907 [Agaricus bisporus var. burnettii JB137-S8]EKM81839.1 hypothetical protein AGABI1DRAFT_118907 [Agaricus bisporus var. burnettii JB137-S8]KAF7770513.1 transcriptional regulator family: Fungal Specific TF [Agaricus bisporus var. burnettii]